MKQLGYYFFKCWISLGLFFYFKRIRIVGLDNVPKNKPVLFLSNHQNALLDVLLIATRGGLRPWYLTRSDVFKNKFFSPLFYFLQMLPIYRIRDGKDTLSKNQVIFNRCGALLNANEMLLIFPEANQNLKRRVRPLSKGFTRILFKALEADPDLDIQLVPVGQNYMQADGFPDSTALHFGRAIAIQDLLLEDKNKSVVNIKSTVAEHLKQLTTHIEDETAYDKIEKELKDSNVDFLDPVEANNLIKKPNKKHNKKNKHNNNFIKWCFMIINLPIVFIWRSFIKPKVPELEFMGTFRFAFSMLVYPIFYGLLTLILTYTYNIKTACLLILVHAVLNLVMVKIGFTSSSQRK